MNALVAVESTPTAGRQGEGHTVFSPRRQGEFLRQLQLFGNVRLACRSARVSAQTAYRVRRRSAAFARAWDAALVAARAHGEAVLADRAVNGWEEPVFYHGEEIARRRRFSDRLLLAHLARLDRMEERAELAGMIPILDDVIEGLEAGRDIEELVPPVEAAPEPAQAAAHTAAHTAAIGPQAGGEGAETNPQDRVPPVPSCRVSSPDDTRDGAPAEPCPDCGGACDDPAAELGPQDCQWLGNRLDRMDAARPESALNPYALAREAGGEADGGAVEAAQLAAFEAGEEDWWTVLPPRVDAGPGEADQASAGVDDASCDAPSGTPSDVTSNRLCGDSGRGSITAPCT